MRQAIQHPATSQSQTTKRLRNPVVPKRSAHCRKLRSMSGRGSCSISSTRAPAAWLYSPERLTVRIEDECPFISPDGLAQLPVLKKALPMLKYSAVLLTFFVEFLIAQRRLESPRFCSVRWRIKPLVGQTGRLCTSKRKERRLFISIVFLLPQVRKQSSTAHPCPFRLEQIFRREGFCTLR